MGTPFTEVFDEFMLMQTDYRLVNLFNASPENFTIYLTGWLKPAVTDFENICDQSLTYSVETKNFSVNLTTKNIVTLAKIIKLYWLNRTVDDITQMNAKIKDKDFTFYSEAQNYATKQNRLIQLREEISQILVGYSLGEQSTWDMLLSVLGG